MGRNTLSEHGMYPNERTYPTYQEARALMHARKIKSRKAYKEWHRAYRVQFVPYAPENVYRRQGTWEDWNDFLGNANSFDKTDKNVYLPFWEAARWAQGLQLKSSSEWRTYIKENQLPKGIPKNPVYAYRDTWGKGVGWTEWLGLNLNVQLKAHEEVQEQYIWGFISLGGNVFKIIKETKAQFQANEQGKYRGRVLAKYQYEKELEQQMWDHVNRITNESYDHDSPSVRVCSNVYQALSGLNQFLLRAR